MAATLGSVSTTGFAAGLDTASFQVDETSPADRAPALGSRPFLVEHGATDPRVVSAVRVTAENPLADRAAALGGEAFTVKSAESRRYHTAPQTSAETDEATGNPLAERAATLGGKVYTVEHSVPSQSFLARFN